MRIDLNPSNKFVLRTASIFLHDNSVLLHRAEHEDIWALPGGGCEFFEDTKSALVREVNEELKASVLVKSLAFSVENFFEWSGKKAHEIGFYYLTEFTDDSIHYYENSEFVGVEEKMEGLDRFRLFFKWFPLNSLSELNIKPTFLKSKLPALGKETTHIVHRDH